MVHGPREPTSASPREDARTGAPGAEGAVGLSELLEHTTVAIAAVDTDGYVTSMTGGITEISGLSPERYVGMHWTEFSHPDDLELARVATEELEAAPDGTRRSFRIRYLNSAGRWTGVEVEVTRMLDRDPHVFVVVIQQVGALEDHPDRVEALLRSVIHSTPDALLLVDDDGVVAWASPSASTASGRNSIVGLSAADVVHPDDLDSIVGIRGRFDSGEGPIVLECRMREPGGGWRWMRVLATDLRDVDGVEGVVLMLSDVTDAVLDRIARAESEERLRRRNDLLESLAFSSTTGLFEQDSVNGLVAANANWVEITGVSEEAAQGTGWHQLFDPADLGEVQDLGGLPPGLEEPVRRRLRRPDGEYRWVDMRSTVLPADADGVVRRVGGIEDVTAMVEAEAGMARLVSVFDTTDDLVLLTSVEGDVLYANQAVTDFFGAEIPPLQDHPDFAEVVDGVTAALAPGGAGRWSGEVTLSGRSGEVRPMSLEVLGHFNEDGSLSYLSTTGRDISERIALQQQLELQATHDPLTGLPNRAMLFDRIHRASQGLGVGTNRHLALLFIDLDHFKNINDSLGHSVGDQLLCAIARRVRTVVRPSDLVGRFGGDEFVVLCEDLEDDEAATAVAGRIEMTLEAPFRVDGHDIHVGVSIGIALADETHDAEAVLRDADTAMYRAKSGGRGQWVVFDEALRRHAVERQQIESELRAACNDGSLELHYQPIVDLSNGRINYLEALLRWRRGDELVGPSEFMSVAEETGLIVRIGEWVLAEACRQAALWQGLADCGDLGISVNVSARQLQRGGFVPFVAGAIEASGVAPGTLALEITETTLLDDEDRAVAVLDELRSLDLQLSIDDFGTGYSSLTYLHRFPVDMVKLDQSFVQGICADRQKRAIVEAVVNLSEALGLDSVAEGVETDAQLSHLRELGCNFAQGHLFAPALDPRAMGAILRTGRILPPRSEELATSGLNRSG